jgi:hypothetical protein
MVIHIAVIVIVEHLGGRFSSPFRKHLKAVSGETVRTHFNTPRNYQNSRKSRCHPVFSNSRMSLKKQGQAELGFPF